MPSVPAPPIPPNPEKDALLKALSNTLIAQLNQTVASNHSAIGPLQAQQVALRQAMTKLQAELDQLQHLDTALASNESILLNSMREADRVVEDSKSRQVPEVDEVLVAPTVVGNQLYTLCAEERAVGDAMFVLGRGLDGGRVGFDTFVKVGFVHSLILMFRSFALHLTQSQTYSKLEVLPENNSLRRLSSRRSQEAWAWMSLITADRHMYCMSRRGKPRNT